MALILKSYIYNIQLIAMKVIKQLSSILLMLVFITSFLQCTSAQKLQQNAPVEFGEVYYQKWTAGIKEGGSGLNIFIPVTNTSTRFDSVYFRGKATKLEANPNQDTVLIGRFKTETNQKKDIILSHDAKEEYVNQMPVKTKPIPFDLNHDECIVSYKKGHKTLYYKISNIIEKMSVNYPGAPPNKQ
ncbi:hypothetical protein [Psychroserpens sp. SPM9]|uniref:hypothetical protein n=1 Tax=Psychroserpens sp. SPM9 TaxID=2975598 RepID=UPI0021A6EBF2|nr:hypothetical protein [Psychroserpens sp. SPM9]MDG5491143.1 hypothetical protein [Psychroserpens sp. SPM9]